MAEIDWRAAAESTGSVEKWYNALKAKDPRLANVPVTEYMQNDPSGYDYQKALESGVRPVQTEHGDMRWISDNPDFWKAPQRTQQFESYVPSIYRDTQGHRTIGYGFNIDDPAMAKMIPAEVLAGKRPLYKSEADAIFQVRYQQAMQDAQNFVGADTFNRLDPARRETLIDMSYNLGPTKLAGFVKFKRALLGGDYNTAANEMINSAWYNQVGRRSKYHVRKMRGQ